MIATDFLLVLLHMMMVASMESSFLVSTLVCSFPDWMILSSVFLQCNLDLLLGAIDLLENPPLGTGNRSKLRLLGFLLLLGQGIDGESHLLCANLASLGGSIVNVALDLGTCLVVLFAVGMVMGMGVLLSLPYSARK